MTIADLPTSVILGIASPLPDQPRRWADSHRDGT